MGANISKAQFAISKKDFQAKMYIALKETHETLYLLELLFRIELTRWRN
ncbi:MAG: four helix bundle protein [Paludibacteraceae bacterium]|nr:four helix bundle protein [Paludibacteraceae bacterium]